MVLRQSQGRDARSAPGRWLLAVVLLPALLLGPGLGGLAAWFHAHGPSGPHLHLLAAQSRHGQREAVHAWHAAQHRHGHETGTPEEEDPAPGGLLVEFSELLAVAPRGRDPAPASIELPAPLSVPRWHLAAVESTHRHDLCRSAWPPQGAQRSGVAALVRSSHALLI